MGWRVGIGWGGWRVGDRVGRVRDRVGRVEGRGWGGGWG